MKPVSALCCLLLFVAPGAFAHDGEDHGAPAPAVTQSVSPRATAASEDFEAVIVLEGKKLVLYLDRLASNEPVAGAKVEVEGAGLQGVAAETSPGVYALDAASITAQKHALTISIEVGNSADLLSATLDAAPAVPVDIHVHSWGEWAVWYGAAALALLALALLAVRRARNGKEIK